MYRVDFIRFALQLLPPILRGGVLMALLKVMVLPVRHVYDAFVAYRERTNSRLYMTGNVIFLQKVLNDEFRLSDNQIFIETPEVVAATVMFLKCEGQEPWYVGLDYGKALLLSFPDEMPMRENFVLHVPTFLCSSLNEGEDEYGGVNLRRIKKLLDYYKPAGRWYRIELYDYE